MAEQSRKITGNDGEWSRGGKGRRNNVERSHTAFSAFILLLFLIEIKLFKNLAALLEASTYAKRGIARSESANIILHFP